MAARWVIQKPGVHVTRALEGVNSPTIELKANVYHLAGAVNPADPLTKAMKPDNLIGTILHDYSDFLRASQLLDPTVKSMLLPSNATGPADEFEFHHEQPDDTQPDESDDEVSVLMVDTSSSPTKHSCMMSPWQIATDILSRN